MNFLSERSNLMFEKVVLFFILFSRPHLFASWWSIFLMRGTRYQWNTESIQKQDNKTISKLAAVESQICDAPWQQWWPWIAKCSKRSVLETFDDRKHKSHELVCFGTAIIELCFLSIVNRASGKKNACSSPLSFNAVHESSQAAEGFRLDSLSRDSQKVFRFSAYNSNHDPMTERRRQMEKTGSMNTMGKLSVHICTAWAKALQELQVAWQINYLNRSENLKSVSFCGEEFWVKDSDRRKMKTRIVTHQHKTIHEVVWSGFKSPAPKHLGWWIVRKLCDKCSALLML